MKKYLSIIIITLIVGLQITMLVLLNMNSTKNDYDLELEKAENRPSDDGFLSGDCDNTKHLYGVNGAGVTHDYVGIVRNYDERRNIALVEVKNYFELNI